MDQSQPVDCVNSTVQVCLAPGEGAPLILKNNIASNLKSILAKGLSQSNVAPLSPAPDARSTVQSILDKISTPLDSQQAANSSQDTSSERTQDLTASEQNSPNQSNVSVVANATRRWVGAGNLCIAFGCKTTSRDGGRFHKVPWRNEELRKIWLLNCGREDLLALAPEKLKHRYVCREHFNKNDYEINGRLRLTAFPTVFKVSKNSLGRYRFLLKPWPWIASDILLGTNK